MKSLFFIFLLAVRCGAAVGVMREYIFINVYKNWTDAHSYCQIYYRNLADVNSMEENNRLMQVGSSSEGWLGLRRDSLDPTKHFINWCSSCPNTHVNCIYILTSGLWNSGYCPKSKQFYCDRFLILVKEKKTWEEAREFCRTNYTGLVSVPSETSLWQLNQETVGTETESVWTGLRFMDGQWVWANGEPNIQLGSLVSMPSCPALFYRCGALNTTTNTMKNQNCNERLNFICYW
ncbi:snaclec agglucetin subunit alpha-2-like isoform X1 [Hemibagrus wyckioides]|uniref:snaclec agglucetin subunit alpha-2-like isoform X1 n=1 Tax=Hemibagrus wyckioides TaxID=337641 RepID=UPI00266D1C83|nr:snaclec agglucetin subunit alpha-2-like isoform X1 [Hemibagrus wyckioides]XP_058243765.1 snaclec agglucetin subunit alpha-2-like isoform X2 [Hemibagrus wyckioides]XP_058243766.1 snaclec agglucetin subunit alpha-2-like isoform X1 [Hemibagrus wyckioides]